MKPTLQDLEQRSKALELDQAKLTADIARLKEAGAEAQGPWEPQGGNKYLVLTSGAVTADFPDKYQTKAGRAFGNNPEAVKASRFFTFYQRLYQLALECDHKTGPKANGHSLMCVKGTWKPDNVSGHINPCTLFRTYVAAKTACDIMNRDKWVMPTI